ncbi:hypothetical protein [Microbacterium sp.]|uniref:hypothetical protein n=1 Tax=Microbacterium sp. TaxID=51671 RepID=UPI002811C257|nr:hypothetical protein [Microbacterium sp.]
MIEAKQSADPRRPPRPRINWGAVVGFGTLGLLWPLLRLVGLEAVIGGLATALVAFITVSTVWMLGAGFGRVPRPVATLTLSGALLGILVGLTTLALGEWPDHGIAATLVAGAFEVGRSAGVGALTGFAAEAIQRGRRR